MPGASSRTTGSATRWNSLTPLFMRQGRDQPLRVTTGLYGRPLGGTSGGIVAAEAWTGASGRDAAPALLTSDAPTMAAPAPVRKDLRDVICGVPLSCRARPCGRP